MCLYENGDSPFNTGGSFCQVESNGQDAVWNQEGMIVQWLSVQGGATASSGVTPCLKVPAVLVSETSVSRQL